jgi:hypothetical protein
MNEEKRRGRPPKLPEAPEAPEVPEVPEVATEEQTEAPTTSREMTFAEVMAWNDANRDKLPPAPVLPAKVKPKLTRF